MKREAKQLLWLDDNRGIYIPRDFARSFKNRDAVVSGVSTEDWEILETGPDHELYWDSWQDVLDNAQVTDVNGGVYGLWQDGPLWLLEVGAQFDETGTISDTGWYIDDGKDE